MTTRGRWLVAGLFVSVLLLGALLALSDLGELRRQVAHARAPLLVAAALASLASYAATGGMYHALLGRLGHPLPWWTVTRAVIVSLAANRSIRSGGLSGFAALAWFLGRSRVPAAAVLSAAIGFWFLGNGGFVTLFGAAVASAGASVMHGEPPFTLAHVVAGLVGVLLLTLVLATAWLVARSERARSAVLAVAIRVVSRVARTFRRPHWTEAVRTLLDRALARSSLAGHRLPVTAMAWTVVRLAGSAGALALVLLALDVRVSAAVLVFAYTTGKAAGVLSIVPAGLGIVEGSTAGVLTSLGVPYETALAAVLLHRGAYHLVPALVAIALAGPLLRAATAAPTDP